LLRFGSIFDFRVAAALASVRTREERLRSGFEKNEQLKQNATFH
jgi:hypothetical protein